jgi:heavy metal translocating P-type ATPase
MTDGDRPMNGTKKRKTSQTIIYSKEFYIAILALACIGIHLMMRFSMASWLPYAEYPLYLNLGIGGSALIYDLLKKLLSRNFGSDLLAGMSIITSVLLGEYLAGSLVVLMLSGGEALETFAIKTASKMLEALSNNRPTIAHLKKSEEIIDIAAEEVKIGDTVVIFPNEVCPVDGEVIEGHGKMDESYLTGEPFMLSKAPGSQVFSGTINGDTSLTVKATKHPENSRYAKIIEVVSESEQKKPKLRRLADQLGALFTPLAVFIAVAAWLATGDAVRFLAVLVIATPCPLLIAIPVAIIGSISTCAKRSILIKDPVVLEQISQCKTLILDKTGTLTYGTPTLTEQTIFTNIDPKQILKYVASVERYSKHPLAGAILEKAETENIQLLDAQEIHEPKGAGMQAVVDGHRIAITSRKQIPSILAVNADRLPPSSTGLECIILIDGALAAQYKFHDAPRSDSTSFITHLPLKHGIEKMMIVSGDRIEEVAYLAGQVGIQEIYASQSPEQKVVIVERETRLRKTAFLGDGINDAPALLVATVGIAFGENSDITAEAAGAVIMKSSLETVDEFLHISKRMRTIALQSAIGGMLLSFIGMIIAALGFLTPVAGAIAQEIIDVIVVLNALRTIRLPKVISDMPKGSSGR